MSLKQHNYGCTVKQKFASDSKMATSLGTKAHLKNTKHCVLNYCATTPPIFKVLIQHQKSKGEKSTEVR